MRTTVDIPDDLYRRLKSRAALEGCSVKELLLRGAAHQLRPRSDRPRRRVELPLIVGNRPGSLDLDNERIYEIIPFP